MKTKQSIRPLTSLMITRLQECSKMEEYGTPCLPKHFGASLSGLYKRKLIDVRPVILEGREMMCAFLTSEGRVYLETVEQEQD